MGGWLRESSLPFGWYDEYGARCPYIHIVRDETENQKAHMEKVDSKYSISVIILFFLFEHLKSSLFLIYIWWWLFYYQYLLLLLSLLVKIILIIYLLISRWKTRSLDQSMHAEQLLLYMIWKSRLSHMHTHLYIP